MEVNVVIVGACQLSEAQIYIRSAHTVYLCVLCARYELIIYI